MTPHQHVVVNFPPLYNNNKEIELELDLTNNYRKVYESFEALYFRLLKLYFVFSRHILKEFRPVNKTRPKKQQSLKIFIDHGLLCKI